ncbi:helix-turn-helix domain-containing protein [Paraglaciecola aquimarina]|uniref:Helix-turn-helix domain-containing protein n=1 Tax=Paraglaciecola algarum TaxID=3050085 RepID=A0ABS9D979_9ALTE|nr:helix-turn-helix domain-containing protein [Paraglaciecola sp. G1-23]MCF2949431.1 helix-turn-helix domain-containing protein [Paraglaciecola sp. G1-23]
MGKQVTQSTMPETDLILDPVNLGKLIKAKRTAMKMKLADCAALCGVGINTLSRIENGNPNSTLGATFSILKGLGIRLSHLEPSKYTPDDEWV